MHLENPAFFSLRPDVIMPSIRSLGVECVHGTRCFLAEGRALCAARPSAVVSLTTYYGRGRGSLSVLLRNEYEENACGIRLRKDACARLFSGGGGGWPCVFEEGGGLYAHNGVKFGR